MCNFIIRMGFENCALCSKYLVLENSHHTSLQKAEYNNIVYKSNSTAYIYKNMLVWNVRSLVSIKIHARWLLPELREEFETWEQILVGQSILMSKKSNQPFKKWLQRNHSEPCVLRFFFSRFQDTVNQFFLSRSYCNNK